MIKVKTLVTFQVVPYLGKAGLISKTPLTNLLTDGNFLNETLDTGFIRLEKAERGELTELQPLSVLKYSVKNYVPILVII